jgi:hypothetical protein
VEVEKYLSIRRNDGGMVSQRELLLLLNLYHRSFKILGQPFAFWGAFQILGMCEQVKQYWSLSSRLGFQR